MIALAWRGGIVATRRAAIFAVLKVDLTGGRLSQMPKRRGGGHKTLEGKQPSEKHRGHRAGHTHTPRQYSYSYHAKMERPLLVNIQWESSDEAAIVLNCCRIATDTLIARKWGNLGSNQRWAEHAGYQAGVGGIVRLPIGDHLARKERRSAPKPRDS